MGDSVVMRRNKRDVATGGGWVKNGDQGIAIRLGGAIDVRGSTRAGRASRCTSWRPECGKALGAAIPLTLK